MLNQEVNKYTINARKDIIAEPNDFPEIDEENFKLTDQERQELAHLYKQTKGNVVPLLHTTEKKATQEFQKKKRSLLDALDQQQQKLNTQDYNFKREGYTYYSLKDTEYDQKSVAQSAFAFLKELEDRAQQKALSEDMTRMDLQHEKPVYDPKFSKKRMIDENQMRNLKNKLHMLSIQDEL